MEAERNREEKWSLSLNPSGDLSNQEKNQY